MTPTTHTGPREVVLQLFVIVTLYAVAVHVGMVFHQLVNAWVPDPALERGGYGPFASFRGPLRYALAMLVVFVPIHAWARRALHQLTDASADVRTMRSRRWLGYITVAVAGIILAGDLVAGIHRFLDGELTLRFILKAVAILTIAAAVLWYERQELHRGDDASRIRLMRRGGVAMLAVIGVAVVAGFFAAGSPATSRRAQLDQQRVSDLQSIQWRIVEVWQQTGTLPVSLDALRDDISGFIVPFDPETQHPYEYHIVTDAQFELCATFVTDSMNGGAKVPRPVEPYGVPYDSTFDLWAHGLERTCFTRTIDPARYPLRPQPATKR